MDDKQLISLLETYFAPGVSVDVGNTVITFIDDKTIRFQSDIKAAQLQLISELEGEAVMYYEWDSETQSDEPHDAVPLEVLEHKKQELERNQK